jgi:AraC-like DNA-binding protein
MQVVSLPEAQLLFEDLWKAWEGESSLGSLAAFYRLIDRILPSLEKSENRSADRVLPALRYLRENYTAEVRVEELAALCFMSPSRFFEVFRDAVGESPIRYRNKLKLSRAEVLLSEGKTNEEVCELLSFSSPTFLRRMLKKHLGVIPREIKKGVRL